MPQSEVFKMPWQGGGLLLTHRLQLQPEVEMLLCLSEYQGGLSYALSTVLTQTPRREHDIVLGALVMLGWQGFLWLLSDGASLIR